MTLKDFKNTIQPTDKKVSAVVDTSTRDGVLIAAFLKSLFGHDAIESVHTDSEEENK